MFLPHEVVPFIQRLGVCTGGPFSDKRIKGTDMTDEKGLASAIYHQ